MRFDDRTIQILSNFSTIKKGMLFRAGDTLSTMTDGMSILARARIETPVEKQFAIHDMPRFLGVVRLFRDPAVEIGDKTLSLVEGDKRASYTFADADLPGIVKPPTKELKIDADVSFKLPAKLLKEVKDAAAALGYKDLAIVGEKGVVYLDTVNADNPTSDKYRVKVGESKKTFSLVLQIENLRLISTDYDVEASFKGIVHFTGADGLEYFVAIEKRKSVT
jgi:hypothetical protein